MSTEMVAKREEPTEDAVKAGEVQPTVEGEDEGGAGCDVCMPPSFGGAEFVRNDAFARRRARAHASRKPLRSKAAPEKPQVQARGGGRVRLQVHLHAVDAVVEGRRRAAEVSRKRREITFTPIVVHGLPARPRHGRGHRDVGRHAHRGRGFRAGRRGTGLGTDQTCGGRRSRPYATRRDALARSLRRPPRGAASWWKLPSVAGGSAGRSGAQRKTS